MSFFTPALFWGGLAAVSAPIIIHFLNRQRYKRIRWAAMEFLLLAFKRTRRRVRVEHLIILIIRCLLLLMLGALLARPLFSGDSIISGSRDVYVLLDDSYSMGYTSGGEGQTAMDRGRRMLQKIISGLRAQDHLHIIRLSDVIRNDIHEQQMKESNGKFEAIKPFIESGGLTAQEIKNYVDVAANPQELPVSDLHTDIYLGLTRMEEIIFKDPDTAMPIKELYIISDLQKYAWLPAGKSSSSKSDDGADVNPVKIHISSGDGDTDDLNKVINSLMTERDNGVKARVFLMDVGDPNLGEHNDILIQGVTVERKDLVVGLNPNFSVTLRNNSNAKAKNVKVDFLMDGKTVDSKTYVDPIEAGGTAKVNFKRGRFKSDEAGFHYAEIIVDDKTDSLAADSHYYFAFQVREGIKVLIVDGDYSDDLKMSETGVLQIALHPKPMPRRRRGVPDEDDSFVPFAARPKVVEEWRGETLSDYDIVILANVNITASTPDSDIAEMERYVRSGGRLMIFLGDNVDHEYYNKILYKDGEGLLPAQLSGKAIGKQFIEAKGAQEKTTLLVDPKSEVNYEIFGRLLEKQFFNDAETLPKFSRFFPMVVPSDSTIMAKFDKQDPAAKGNLSAKIPFMVQKRYGKTEQGRSGKSGRVVLFNTTTDSAWSNLTVSGPDMAYIVILIETVLYLMRTEQFNVQVGEAITRTYSQDKLQDKEGLFVVTPPGTEIERKLSYSVEDLEDGGKIFLHCVFRDAFKAGRCVFISDQLRIREIFGVNVNLGEADLEHISTEEIQQKYPGLNKATIFKWDFGTEDGGKVEIEGVTASSNAWKLPLLIMLCLLVLESGLALLFGRRASK